MEEKNFPQEAEVEIQQETEYDQLLKKFEQPTENKKPKKTHRGLGVFLSLTFVALLVGALLLMIFFPETSEKNAVEKASIISATDSNGLWSVQAETTENGEIKQNGSGSLLNFVPASIKSIQVENSLGSYEVTSYTPKEKTKETDPETGEETETTLATVYTLVGYENFPLESGAPDDLANDCASLEFTKIISADACENLKDYGLDKPRATATITYTNGSKAIVKVGNDALQGAGTYVSFGNSNAVYIVAVESVDALMSGVNDLISLTINNSADETESANFNYVELSGSAFEENIVFENNKDADSIASEYLITSPKKAFAEDSEASAISGGIRGLMATEVVQLNPTASHLKKYGLSPNYAHLVAQYPDTKVDLIASKPDSSGNCYIMENGGKIIYQISATSIPWVSTTLADLTSEYVLSPKMSGLSKMVVETDTKTEFALSTTTSQTTNEDGTTSDVTETVAYYGSTQLTSGYFETYFTNIALLKTANSTVKNQTGKADLTITYDYSGKRADDVVSFYKSANNMHIVTINSTPIGQIYSSYIEKIIEQTPQITQNKQVSSFW